MSSAIHHIANVSLLQEHVTACCDLPKQNAYPLFNLTEPKISERPQAHVMTLLNSTDQKFRYFKSQIQHITTSNALKFRGNLKIHGHTRTQLPYLGGVALWHAPSDNFSNYAERYR